MKMIYSDFNRTLETGSEFSLARAANDVFKEAGIKKRYTPEELLKQFGKPLSEIIRSDIPNNIDVENTLNGIRERERNYSEKYIRLAYGAEALIREISGRGDVFTILSLVNRSSLNAFLKRYNLGQYARSIVFEDLARERKKLKTFLATSVHPHVSEEFLGFLSRSLNELPSSDEGFKAYELYLGARAWNSDLTVMIGDAKEDMSAVIRANELLTGEYDHLEKEHGIVRYRKSIIGVLFDPNGTKAGISCDYRIKELPEVLRIFY